MKGDAASAWPSTLGHSPWSSDPSDKMSEYPEAATLEGGHAGTTKNRGEVVFHTCILKHPSLISLQHYQLH